MNSEEWKSVLSDNSVLATLSEGETAMLLIDGEEQEYAQNKTIIEEGEWGDSVFLIGSGSVRVFVRGEGDRSIPIATLKRGELFGELAVITKRERTATVVAKETCSVLKIKGEQFLDMMQQHSDIEFRILLNVCDRLRHLGEHVLSLDLADADERIKLFNTKLDLQQKAVDAELKATQTVFDETNKRVHEIIDAADRSRTRFTVTASTFGTIIAAVVAILGFFGISEFHAIKTLAESAGRDATTVKEVKREAEQTRGALVAIEEQIEQFREQNEQFKEARVVFYTALRNTFFEAIQRGNETDALGYFSALLDTGEKDIIDKLIKLMYREVLTLPQRRNSYKGVLEVFLEDKAKPLQLRILPHHLYLITLILDEGKEHDQNFLDTKFSEYSRLVGVYQGGSLKDALKAFDPAEIPEVYDGWLDNYPNKATRFANIKESWALIP